MKKDKSKLILIIIGLISFIIGTALWLFMDWSQTGLDTELIILPIPMIFIVITTIIVVMMNYKNIKRGLPMKDEMSRKAEFKAGAYAFYLGIYLLLALGMFGDNYFERPSQATGAGILGMAIIFFIFWIYFNKKGNIN